jgi:aminoglycoside 6'-N-acetyltransferase
MITRINPEGLHRTPGYHHITVVEAGRTAHLAGQCPLDVSGTLVGPDDLDAQVDQVVANALRALAAVAAGPENVIRSVIYVVSTETPVLASVWDRLNASPLAPAFSTASTLLGVARLGFTGQLVEIDLTATLPDPPAEMEILQGNSVTLRPLTSADVPALVEIRATPEVLHRWRGGEDLTASVTEDLDDPGTHVYVIEYDGRVVGAVQWGSEDTPDYRHASIDIYLSPDVHGKGLGADAVRTLARYLITEHGFHRLVIDPAADNTAAIRCYEKVGFRPVGIMRRYERGGDGTWHDGLMMDLLAEELR